MTSGHKITSKSQKSRLCSVNKKIELRFSGIVSKHQQDRGREQKPTEVFTQVVIEQMGTTRSLPYFIFSGSPVF